MFDGHGSDLAPWGLSTTASSLRPGRDIQETALTSEIYESCPQIYVGPSTQASGGWVQARSHGATDET